MGFPGGGMGNMQAMMKKVQKMQADMMKKQEEIKSKTIETSAGGGAVTVVVNGKKEICSLTIKPEACDPDDVEMLQDMLITAINDGMKQIDDYSEREMAKITGGMKLPGM
ncbi:MAG: YbaB/EbfC family nucleoid-associated protein [Phascolarctobacterium sp.]|nr:YbaB/EbfC family nucleoid-associated protein [Phascolarctobacterium sp.]